MHDLFLVLSAFLATCVEMVETLTIILAVGITKGFKTALTGMVSAIVVLSVVVAVLGKSLVDLVPLDVLLVTVGGLLLIFGMQWLRKAILRAAGLKAEHDEDQIFADEVRSLVDQPSGTIAGLDWQGFVVSFKGTFLEGLEVAFIVIAIAANTGRMDLAMTGAGIAIVFLSLVGVIIHKPLSAVPENTIKHFVGIMLMAFGTFWGAEGVGVSWNLDVGGIIGLCLFYWVVSLILIARLKRDVQPSAESKPIGAGV
jgi:uncharacterized membrane protein